MAKLSWDEIQTLWSETPQPNWLAFALARRERRDKRGSIDDKMVDRLISYSQGMEWAGHEFLGSASEPYEMLNERLVGESPESRSE